MNTYAVDLYIPRVYAKTNGTIEQFNFRTKRQADRKILELIQAGYKFDPQMWEREIRRSQPLPMNGNDYHHFGEE